MCFLGLVSITLALQAGEIWVGHRSVCVRRMAVVDHFPVWVAAIGLLRRYK
jgi:hypothetical protein